MNPKLVRQLHRWIGLACAFTVLAASGSGIRHTVMTWTQSPPPLRDIEGVVIDGDVWLDEDGRAGLGAHLCQALGGKVAVVGVAITRFHEARGAREVLRGGSRQPLYVTAEGVELAVAAGWVRAMQGAHRIPSLISRVDHLARVGLK